MHEKCLCGKIVLTLISTKKTSMFDVSLNRTSKITFPRKILDVLQQGISSLIKKNSVIRVLLPFVQCPCVAWADLGLVREDHSLPSSVIYYSYY